MSPPTPRHPLTSRPRGLPAAALAPVARPGPSPTSPSALHTLPGATQALSPVATTATTTTTGDSGSPRAGGTARQGAEDSSLPSPPRSVPQPPLSRQGPSTAPPSPRRGSSAGSGSLRPPHGARSGDEAAAGGSAGGLALRSTFSSALSAILQVRAQAQ